MQNPPWKLPAVFAPPSHLKKSEPGRHSWFATLLTKLFSELSVLLPLCTLCPLCYFSLSPISPQPPLRVIFNLGHQDELHPRNPHKISFQKSLPLFRHTHSFHRCLYWLHRLLPPSVHSRF